MAGLKGHTHAAAFDEGFLQVSPLHAIYYAQYGKQDGKPVVFLHGGPGGSTSMFCASFFDPSIYRVVLLDQRGCGKSRPAAETKENTTPLLIQDIESLRSKLEIKKWHMVFGGSWGSTLALAYAEVHPETVGSLVLRGIFFAERQEISQSLSGAPLAQMYPEEWEAFIGYLPEEKRGDALNAFNEIIGGDDKEKAYEAAMVWSKWGMLPNMLVVPADVFAPLDEMSAESVIGESLLILHYFVNGSFMEEGQIYQNLDKIKNIPMSIVQGRYDVVCPPITAWRLHKALPDSKMYWIANAGHSSLEPPTFKKLVEICDEYAQMDFHL
ncbi:proline iminopeptidase [Melanomma pulvis-pyrius CBS 109.77]|uniref:Proline iminopeptidase n=1 Tax=Melanomma pulvis-pyrius CBS 109.77 TaxID=1314802 RepID=A0A6A6X6I0_9PLEO|nr:proline iminopeptidase [Melanomma pulvis-pyrius CBS 109.77]